MDAEEDEVAVTLDWIINRVSNDLENNKIEEVSQCDLMTSSDHSNEERSCRICYDLTLVPIIYPCRCKVMKKNLKYGWLCGPALKLPAVFIRELEIVTFDKFLSSSSSVRRYLGNKSTDFFTAGN